MSNDLSTSLARVPIEQSANPQTRQRSRPQGSEPASGGTASPAPARDVSSPSPQAVLDTAATQAARDLYQGRDVAVTGMIDDHSGRMVYRVTDRNSGEVLAQSPSDELLRFYASGRAEDGAQLIAIEA